VGDGDVIRVIESRGPSFGWWLLVGALAVAGIGGVVLARSGGVKAWASLFLLTAVGMMLRAFAIRGGVRGRSGVAVTDEGLRSRYWSIAWSDVERVSFWGPGRGRVLSIRPRAASAVRFHGPRLLLRFLLGRVVTIWIGRDELESQLLGDLEIAAGREL
jgi:hypothetical protein